MSQFSILFPFRLWFPLQQSESDSSASDSDYSDSSCSNFSSFSMLVWSSTPQLVQTELLCWTWLFFISYKNKKKQDRESTSGSHLVTTRMHPRQKKATTENRTRDLLITSQMHYHCAIMAVDVQTDPWVGWRGKIFRLTDSHNSRYIKLFFSHGLARVRSCAYLRASKSERFSELRNSRHQHHHTFLVCYLHVDLVPIVFVLCVTDSFKTLSDAWNGYRVPIKRALWKLCEL